MTNSLSTAQIASLCDDFLKLFECQSREHKQKVPCLIGPSNSGKTSLFMATNKIIDPSKVARVTKQREFNKAMIDEETELINLDEARVELMEVDDWKIITQGLLILSLSVSRENENVNERIRSQSSQLTKYEVDKSRVLKMYLG